MPRANAGSPYVFGSAIEDPGDFYGRKELVDRFFADALQGGAVTSMYVTGVRRSGKTSFLNHISHPDVLRRRLRTLAKNTVVVYVDLLTVTDQRRFYATLLRETDRAFGVQHGISPRFSNIQANMDHDVVAKYFREYSVKWRILIMLDEFDALFRRTRFDQSFFDGLRALSSGNLAWLTASLDDPFVTLEGQDASSVTTSPLGNIFLPPPLQIGSLSVSDAESLVARPARKRGIHFTTEDVGYVIELAGRLPHTLQAAARHLFDAYKGGKVGEFCQEQVRTKFIQTITPSYKRWWQSFTDEQRYKLAELAADRQPSLESNKAAEASEDLRILETLIGLGFLERIGGTYRVLGSAFAEWICMQPPPRGGQPTALGSPTGRLRDILAGAFSDLGRMKLFVLDAGLAPANIDWSGAPSVVWQRILNEAERQGKVESLLAEACEAAPILTDLLESAGWRSGG